MRPARYDHTRVFVELHLHGGRVITINGKNPDVGAVVSCSTNKTFGEAAGSFTIGVKRIQGLQPSWLSQVDDPEDVWVRIVWVVNGVQTECMWGLTESFSENVTRGSKGERVETVTITGKDFGKVFEKTILMINIYEQGGVLPTVPLYSAVAERLIGSPDEIVRTLIDAWVGNNGINDRQWILPSSIMGGDARYFYDWCRYDAISRDLRGRTFAPTLLSTDRQSASLWDTMQEYSNGVLNEMWCDLVPISPSGAPYRRDQRLRPAIIMRERPFPTIKSRARWDGLPTHTLEPEDIQNRNIVSDGADRFNYWQLEAQGLGGAGFSTAALIQQATTRPPGQPGNVPIYDLDSIRKHGFRRFMQGTRYLPANEGAEGGGAVWLAVAAIWQRIVHDWYVTAPLQYTGSIKTSRLRPEIRLGDRLFENRRADGTQTDDDWTSWEYYIEGVAHSYAYPNAGETTLTVTRGQPRNANFLAAQYQKYTGLDISTLNEDEADAAAFTAVDAETSAFEGAGPVGADSGLAVAPETGPTGSRAADGSGPDSPIDGATIVSTPDPSEEAGMTDADFAPSGSPVPNADDPLAGILGITADDLSGLDNLDGGSPAPAPSLPPRDRRGHGSGGSRRGRRGGSS